MATGADVRSIPALAEWLAALKVFQTAAADAVGGTNMELRRAVDWVADQAQLWKREVRNAEEAVVQAKAELNARQFPGYDGRMPDTTLQERNLRRANARLDHAHDRVRTCQGWLSRLPKLIEETYAGRAHRLGVFLDTDLERALAVLVRRLDALERYAEVKTDYRAAPVAPPPLSAEGEV